MRLAALIAALALCCALAAPASAVVVHQADGHFLGVTPLRGVSTTSIPGSAAGRSTSAAADSGTLNYHGGPVVHSSAPYLIFWTPSGESLPNGSAALLERYFTDTAAASGNASNVFAVDRQYTDGSGFADYQQTFSTTSQAIVDTQPYPSSGCSDTNQPTCLSDAQLEHEVHRLIVADGLPSDGPASAAQLPARAPIYFVVLPPDVNVCFGGSQCSDNYFCAYHSSFTDGAGDTVLYAAIPTVLAVSDPKSCQSDGNSAVQEPNGTAGDVVVNYTSHETSETITDPLGTGWWDSSSNNEGGDNCAFFGSFAPAKGTNPNAYAPALGGSAAGGTLYDQLVSGDEYYTQSEWSNGDTNCELQPSPGSLSPRFTAPSGTNRVGVSLSFDPTSSTSTNPISSETWDFGDGNTAFQTGSPVPVSHAYAAAGTYDVKLTLVDDRGNLATASGVIEVGNPTASFTSSPSSPVEGGQVSFDASGSSDPDAGVTINSYSWDFGDGTTGSGETTSHVYAHYGTYTVTLNVTNSVGLASSTSRQVTVTDEPPAAQFTVATLHPAARVPVKFSATASSDPDGTISSYVWSFGDGATGSGGTPKHTYSAAGTYTVTLTVIDSTGLTTISSERLLVVRGSRITKISVVARKGVRFLVVAVNGPGWLSVGRRTYVLGKVRTARMRIRLTASESRALLKHQRLTLRIRLVFAPTIGAHQSRTVKLRLRL